MSSIEYYYDLLDEGFSLITARKDKVPNVSWKQYQDKAVSKEAFEQHYAKSDTEIIGIVTGFDGLECIDVDLKVFSTEKEKTDFWNEYLSFLKDNIDGFDNKFVIYQTVSGGYHILYKSKRVEGNKKIAKLKGHKEAVIESRGFGGYVVDYNGKNITDKTYGDIEYISDKDREVLWSVSKSYDYFEPPKESVATKVKSNYDSLTPWDDYDNRTSTFDLISDQFKIVRDLSDRLVIKRHGADSVHSGYIFKDTGLMYLFSTGTTFEALKTYSPFSIYAHLNHNDDWSATAKDLYHQGYGDRYKEEPTEQTPKKDDNPYEIFLMSDYIRMEAPPVTRLIGDLIYSKQQTILFGDTNIGKSLLAIQIAIAIAKGEDLDLGTMQFKNETEPTHVVYYDFELSLPEFQARMKHLPDDLKTLHIARIERGKTQATEPKKTFEELKYKADTVGAKCIIIDNISKISGDLEKTENAKAFMDPFWKLCKDEGYTVIIIAHTTKRSKNKHLTENDLGGSSKLNQLCDALIGMASVHGNDNEAYIKQLKVRMAEKEFGEKNVIHTRIGVDRDRNVVHTALGLRSESSLIYDFDKGLNDDDLTYENTLACLYYGSINKAINAYKEIGMDTPRSTFHKRVAKYQSINGESYDELRKLGRDELYDLLIDINSEFPKKHEERKRNLEHGN